jgi:excisionase family DNA binding protein
MSLSLTNEESPKALNEFMPVTGLAAALNVSKPTVSRWVHDLGLPAIRLGGRLYFHEPAVAAWLKARERVRDGEET